ncbi:MAG: RNA polymerase sigma factor [Eubacteriales bacterium]|nr:RNA polymerase sigma factor [Eubacteriales bacterium]
MKDREMIRQIQRGHREYLNNIVEQYYDEILHFCIYQLKDVPGAYDITQETFYRFIKTVDSYEYRNLKGYLLTIARNLCVDYWRGRMDAELDSYEEESSERDEGLQRVEDKMVLAELLSKLPEVQREVIVLRFYCDLKLKEIAAVLDTNISTVKSRLRLGIRNLRKEMPEEYEK